MRWSYFKIRIVIVLVVLLIAGIGLTVNGIKDTASLNNDVPDMNTMSGSDFKPGMFVHGKVYYCYGNFAYYYEESDYSSEEKVLREYYIMALEEEWTDENPKFIVISASDQEQIDALSRLIDQTYDYENGTYTEDEIDWEDIDFIGQVKDLETDTEDLLFEYFQSSGFLETDTREEFESYIVPYEIQYKEPHEVQGSLYGGLVMIAIPVAVGAVLFGISMKKKHQNASAFSQAGNYTYANNQPNGFNENQNLGGYNNSQLAPNTPYANQTNPYSQQNSMSPVQPTNLPPMNSNPYQATPFNTLNTSGSSQLGQNYNTQPESAPKPAEMDELNTDTTDFSKL